MRFGMAWYIRGMGSGKWSRQHKKKPIVPADNQAADSESQTGAGQPPLPAIAPVPEQPGTPWWEGTLFWGTLGIFGGVVFGVLAMVTDLRWLLVFAWPFGCLAAWAAIKGICRHNNWKLTASATIILAGGLYLLGSLIPPSKTAGGTAHQLFTAELRTAIINGAPGPLSAYVVSYSSMDGVTVSPVFFILYIRIVNLQDIPVMVGGYKVSVSHLSPTGPWEDLIPIPLKTHRLWFLGMSRGAGASAGGMLVFPYGSYYLGTIIPSDHLKYAAEANPSPALDDELSHSIIPHQTSAGGPYLIQTKRSGTPPRYFKYFKIALHDTAGGSWSGYCQIPMGKRVTPEAETESSAMEARGPTVDFSSAKIRYYSDPVVVATKPLVLPPVDK